jgi:23S rRNA (uracil1939-C5)-methyltransferase
VIVRLKAGSLVHGGETLARHEGRVVFLRGAAPGDWVEAELSGGAGRFERARALRVVERGGARVDPPCPIVDRCGGCPVQQITYQAQLAAKSELTADALERIGGFARGGYQLSPIVPGAKQFHYRRRARMHRAGQGRWGFARAGESAVHPVDECLLFEPELQQLADAASAAGDLPGVTDLGLLSGSSGKGAIDLRGEITPGLRKRAEKLLALEQVKGITLSGTPCRARAHGVPIFEVLGDPVIADPPLPNGARLRARPDTFTQSNRSMVPLLQAEVLRAVGDAPRVLELFCGSGTLTLPLLGGGRSVTAVESAGPALALLRRSADEAGLGVHLIAGDAAEIARGFTGHIDAVLLDPPRTGAAAAVKALKAPRVVYVSCDAPTLARDGKLLAQSGYRLVKAVPLDLFPQTAQFEIVATFERGVAQR